MTIDKFGRSSSASSKSSFVLTEDGSLDIQHKRISNLSKPINPSDATTKRYIDEKITQINSLKNEMRAKIFTLSTTLTSVQEKLKTLDEALSKENLKKGVIIALPQHREQKSNTVQSSLTPSSMLTSNENKRMRIE